MTLQEIITYILGAVGTIALFFGKLYVEDLRARITLMENVITKLSDVYLKRDEFREFKTELFARLDKMETAVESRLDSVVRAYSLRDFKDI